MTAVSLATRLARWAFLGIPLCAVLLVVGGGYALTQLDRTRIEQDVRSEVLNRLGAIRAKLEGAITANLLLARGLKAEIALNPDLSQQRFEQLARQLLHSGHQIRNVAAARDLIISHVYPFEENRITLGIDYRMLEGQREAALRAVESGELIVAGPLELVQGGIGLIGRSPVYHAGEDPPRLWGLLATVLDVEAIYQLAGLHDGDSGLRIAIRGRDGLGAQGAVFFGDPALFDADSVILDVTLPGGNWQLAAVPIAGWPESSPLGPLIHGMTTAMALLIGLLTLIRARQLRERQQAEQILRESEARLADAIESINEGFVLWDPNDRLVLCNTRYREYYQPIAELITPGAPFIELFRACAARKYPDSDPDLLEQVVQARLKSHHAGGEPLEEQLISGRWLYITEKPTADGGIVGIYTDVTELKQAEADIRFRANFDALTHLPNRASFTRQLSQAIARNRRTGQQLAVLFIDLDLFKHVNDTLGHRVGDELLKTVSGRLLACVRDTDTVARFGGDEFTVLLPDLQDALNANRVAETIIRQLRKPYHLDGHEIYSGASIGITLCPDDGDDVEVLLQNADVAMYQAKSAGRNAFRFFGREMTERARHFMALEAELRQALQKRELLLHYQPIVAVADRRLIGVEALVRWSHPQRGWLGPDRFIPVAEETGLIVELGWQVLEIACTEIRPLLSTVPTPFYLAVNISGRQFREDLDLARMRALLRRNAFPPDRLVLEITESLLLEPDTAVRSALDALRNLGIRLSVDDFGTGYSALSYLRRLPVDLLKIDRSFIRDSESNPGDVRLIEAIIAMGKALQLDLVAEGVETEAQLVLLQRLGCPAAQGYYFGRPVPVGKLWPVPGQ